MQTVSSIIAAHRKPYEYWRANKRDATATAEEFQRTPQTIAKWRDEESWIYHADIDDAHEAKKVVQTHEQHKAAAMAKAYDAVADALDNAVTLQQELRAHLASKMADAFDIGAAYSALAKAIGAADTLYSISRINVAVEHKDADTAAIRERLAKHYEQGATA